MKRIVVTLGLAALLLAHPRAAQADAREECAAASENGQRARGAGKLTEARTLFLACSRSACPAVVQHDCATWLPEVEAVLPSVLIDARDAAGHDLVDVRVLIDGNVVSPRLDGRPILLDPGPHTMRYEHGGGVITDDVLIREGEKMRTLSVRFATSPVDGPAPSAPPSPSSAGERRVPTATLVLGGVAAASLVAFGVLAITGQNRFDSCADTKACSESEKDSLRLERGIAWGTLGLGVVALGAAAWFFFTERRAPAPLAP